MRTGWQILFRTGAALCALWLQGCGGAAPESPVDALRFAVTPTSASAHCRYGLHHFEAGLDLNGNGVLDAREVSDRWGLCGAASGAADTLVRISGDADPRHCPAGGFRLVGGDDVDGDGRLSRVEVIARAHLCHRAWTGPSRSPRWADTAPRMLAAAEAARGVSAARAPTESLIRIETAVTAAPCPARATRVTIGIDADRNGTLDAREVELTQVTCSRTPGDPEDGEAVAALPLPADSQVGAMLRVSAAGLPWRIAQGPGQRLNTERLLGPWGGNWAVTGPAGRWTAAAQSADGQRIVAVADGTLLRSEDGGAAWTPLQPADARVRWTAVASSADGRTLAASSREAGIHVSQDGGLTWEARADGHGWGRLAASADLRRLLAERHGRELWLSDDAGRTWRPAPAPRAAWTAVASSADGRVLAAAPRGAALHLSRDGGRSWQAVGEPAGHVAVAVSADGRRLFAASPDGALPLRHSDDLGASWVATLPPRQARLPWRSLAVSAHGHTVVAATADGDLWTSRNGGGQWQRASATLPVTVVTVTAEGLSALALTDGGRLLRAAAATTPGPRGALQVQAGPPLDLRHVGLGVWTVQSSSPATFFVH